MNYNNNLMWKNWVNSQKDWVLDNLLIQGTLREVYPTVLVCKICKLINYHLIKFQWLLLPED